MERGIQFLDHKIVKAVLTNPLQIHKANAVVPIRPVVRDLRCHSNVTVRHIEIPKFRNVSGHDGITVNRQDLVVIWEKLCERCANRPKLFG